MHDDLRFDRYLSVRARGIELPPANIAAVIDRAARRHRHRRAAVSACTAVAVLAAAVSVSSLDGRPATQQVVARAAGGILVESPLAWNVVAPQSGLSWSHSTVIGPNDAVYSLSTAPGAVAVDGASLPATLYRSTDGTEWTPVELPANLHASSLASTSRALYAIGTAPAGGNLRSVQLASTNATNGTWSKTTLPLDVGVLEARYGVKIGLGRLSVASDGSRVVAAVRLQVMEGIDRLLPPGTDAESGYRITEAGIDVLAKPTLPDRAGLEAMGPDAKEARPARPEMNVTASYTWAQLGIDDSLRSLILGEARVFSSGDGQRFDEVQLPEMVRWVGGLFATPDGFRIFGSVEFPLSEIGSWRSTDGHTWVIDANGASAGHLLASGQRQGRVALVTAVEQADKQDIVVKMEQSDGTWSEFGVTDLVRRAGVEEEFYPSGTAAVGPLGVAVLVTSQRGEEPPRSYLVTTADGIEASVIDLAPLVADGYPADVRVTADAITVSFTSATIDGPLRLVVGTPRR
jgi:hypothetical protein